MMKMRSFPQGLEMRKMCRVTLKRQMSQNLIVPWCLPRKNV